MYTGPGNRVNCLAPGLFCTRCCIAPNFDTPNHCGTRGVQLASFDGNFY